MTDRVDHRIHPKINDLKSCFFVSFLRANILALTSLAYYRPPPSPSRTPSFPQWAAGEYSISTVIGTGYSDLDLPDTAATDSSLEFPMSIWLDSVGICLFADSTVIWVVEAYVTNAKCQIFAYGK